MKTSAKVFIWIGMILGGIVIFPIVVGCFALSKINNAKSRDELQTMGILTTLFCSLLGGIFMLCIKDEELGGGVIASTEVGAVKVYTTKKTFYTIEGLDEAAGKARKAIIALMYTLMLFVLSAVVALIVLVVEEIREYDDLASIIIFISWGALITYIVAMVFFGKRRHIMSRVTNALTIAITAMFAVATVLGGLVAIVEDAIYFFGLLPCLICAAIGAIVLLLSYKTNQKSVVVSKHIEIHTESNVELEIKEAQRLLESGVITSSEYEIVRNGILGKYYGVKL